MEKTLSSPIPLEVSARHVHISLAHFAELFGEGKRLTILRKISQPNQFAARETVNVKGPSGVIKNVRIVGPYRDQTQLELSVLDCRVLGIHAAPSLSGALETSVGGLTLEGPESRVTLEKGVIVPLPHLHLSPAQAHTFGVTHLDKIDIYVKAPRPKTFHNVIVRAREGIDVLAFHIDTDEANALGLSNEGAVAYFVHHD